ncbi:hypothetical protein Calab_1523 [Caldithrix abyssi DSM 13497]|uniref:Uncharacterized protein n=1 Tax=Caldithrix abyssi DSM 13497 TaxID=880073 RepID=H1XTE2_CALAY|nr:hypothetical protein [Caldithrix abyssi]APF16986.1 hypothetical protein Cabys_235 [Caldithrix abyssi DSM 13497]APF20325.1 hypothetical protein Cabys_3579 [Caldithrix abyssi DSM 13497]EHO40375.1 hypothetical protein Calab_0736 [Caldithrix abyssi DSM 13497]EHO41143.1 hypothetical protein Calab_1523 [Caldithrix abyssi DSM 13497]
MYAFNEIEKLLSSNVRQILSDPTVYDEFEKQTSYIMRDFSGVDITQSPPPDWTKQPFAWIMEYLVSNRLSSITEEYRQKIETNWKAALKILDKHSTVGQNENPITPNLDNIEDVYSVDF